MSQFKSHLLHVIQAVGHDLHALAAMTLLQLDAVFAHKLLLVDVLVPSHVHARQVEPHLALVARDPRQIFRGLQAVARRVLALVTHVLFSVLVVVVAVELPTAHVPVAHVVVHVATVVEAIVVVAHQDIAVLEVGTAALFLHLLLFQAAKVVLLRCLDSLRSHMTPLGHCSLHWERFLNIPENSVFGFNLGLKLAIWAPCLLQLLAIVKSVDATIAESVK